MKTLIVSEIDRPDIKIYEIRQADGSSILGNSYCSAVSFVAEGNIDDVVGKYNLIRLQCANNLSEIWEFAKATIMLYPKPRENNYRYILTYDGFNRISSPIGGSP